MRQRAHAAAHRTRVVDEARETPAMRRSNDKALAGGTPGPALRTPAARPRDAHAEDDARPPHQRQRLDFDDGATTEGDASTPGDARTEESADDDDSSHRGLAGDARGRGASHRGAPAGRRTRRRGRAGRVLQTPWRPARRRHGPAEHGPGHNWRGPRRSSANSRRRDVKTVRPGHVGQLARVTRLMTDDDDDDDDA